MTTLGDLVLWGRRRLFASPAAPREAHVLLAAAAGSREVDIFSRPEHEVTDAAAARYREWIERRAGGEPLAYVLGEWEFAGRSFAVGPGVLIPRPETEGLLAALLAAPIPENARVLDLCTGSGILALSAALARPSWRVVAADISMAAVAVARGNARRLGARVPLWCGDLAGAVASRGRFDAVVANPPYAPADGSVPVEESVRLWEPAVAVFSGPTGTEVVERLLAAIGPLLVAGGRLFMEIGWGQADWVERRAVELGWNDPCVTPDENGIPRVVALTRA